MRELLSPAEDARLEELRVKSHLSVAESDERAMLLAKAYPVTEEEAKNKPKYPWYIYLVSIVLGGIALYFSNLFINIDTSPYRTTTTSLIIDPIINGVLVATITWLAFSLPRFIYSGEKRIRKEKQEDAMMDRTAEQTVHMAELFEKKNLTDQESAEYQSLINALPQHKEPAAPAPEKTQRKSAHRYPWHLYLISVAIAVPSIAAVMVLSGVLYSSSYLSIPEIVTTLFTWWAVAVVSIWAYRMPRRMYDRKHYQQEEAPLKKYPWYLYLVSIGICFVVYYAILLTVMFLTNNFRFSPGFAFYFRMIFPLPTFAVLSVWAFLIPRTMYDKKRRQQEEKPASTD